MEFVEVAGRDEEATRSQRWSQALTVILAVLALAYGINARAGVLGAATTYTNVRAGIQAEYPQTWLLDETGDYVFRVRDMSRIGFKTTILVMVRPVGTEMTARNVLDGLNIIRPQTLATYGILSIEDTLLPDDIPAVVMNYTYVDVETNPFLESVPVVVLGQDVLTIKGGQAIIVTFHADSLTFDRDVAIFERFLRMLKF